MMQNISRRNFMKGTGAVVLAAACSGLLAGCGGGSSIKADYVKKFVDYRIGISDIDCMQSVMGSKAGVFSVTVAFQMLNDKGLNMRYDKLFDAYIGEEKLTLGVDGSQRITLEDKKNQRKDSASLKYNLTEAQFAKVTEGADIVLHIKPYDSPILVCTVSPLKNSVAFTSEMPEDKTT